MIKRRNTRTVTVGNVSIGSEHPVSIQSMAKTDTADVDATSEQINSLEKRGCEIARVAVKHMEEANAIGEIKKRINIPIVADIHFDYRLALESIKQGVDKIRINPGNITKKDEIDGIISAALDKNIPIRIGVNSGSLMEVATKKGAAADVMVDSLLKYLEYFHGRNFEDIIISLKSSDVLTTVEAYRKMAVECDYPFHLGVTAAGPPADGIIRSSVGIGTLLLEGIGDTIRVSLTGDPSGEIDTAKRILVSAGIRSFGTEIISCPTCGRCQVDLVSLVWQLEEKLKRTTHNANRATDKNLIIAVMGCEVNGPGEARSADIGIAFGSEKGALFRRGEIVKTVDVDHAIEELLTLIEEELK